MLLNETTRIGVLGAGLMGHGLAQVFAVKGCDVAIYDRDEKTLSAIVDRVRSNLDVFVRLGIVKDDEVEPSLKRIRLADSMADMCRERTFIIEAVSENLAVKRRVFSEMERLVPPETILASNTSAIQISNIAESLLHPERVLGTHFWLRGKAYLATMMWAEALRKAGTTDVNAVRKAWEGLTYKGPAGTWTMRACDHQVQQPIWTATIVAKNPYFKHAYVGPATMVPPDKINVPCDLTGCKGLAQ
jgi:hypothetical protein